MRALAPLTCIALSTLLSFGRVDVVHAAGNASPASTPQLFGVHPVQQGSTTLPGGHFNFALVAGQRISDGIVVENFSDHSLIVHVYGADLLTAVGGGLTPAQPTATMHEVGAWITVSAPTITISPHSQITDAFRVAVPAVVSAGQHLGAVVASADAGTSPQGNPIEARVALITVVTVPGVATASGRLTPLTVSPAGSGQRFGITLSNTGNVLLTYEASIDIAGAGGHRVATLALLPTSAYVVPGGKVPLTALWNQAGVEPGDYAAQATIVLLDNGKPAGTLSSQTLDIQIASAFPTLAVVVGGLLIMFAILLALWLRRRRIRYGRILTRERSFPVRRRGLSGVR